ncbi:MAG: HlyD family efflux transporter periplasmic adaptor subunit, partial [Planctomycetota bacterium]
SAFLRTCYRSSPLAEAAYKEEDFPALQLARAARFVRRVGRLLLVLLFVSTLAMFLVPWQQSIRGEGSVVAFDPFERPQAVQAPIKGVIAERGEGVQENAFVEKGQLLFRIRDQDPDYLQRLQVTVQNVETEVLLTRSRRERAVDARDNAERIVGITVEELEAMRVAQREAVTAYNFMIEQATNKQTAAESKLLASEAKLIQVDADYKRKKTLYDEGIETQVKFQEAEQKYRVAEQEVQIAEQDVENASNGVSAKQSERESKRQEWQAKINKVQSQLEKAQADVAKANAEIDKIDSELREKDTKLQKEKRSLAVQQTQEVLAPRDGYVLDLAVFDVASIVKQGDQLCRIVPRTENLAVEAFVVGNDAPLIVMDENGKGPHVRLQFEGWPAAQFSGWPAVAVGTFGGPVSKVDSTDDGAGKFRVVIVPDRLDEAWPGRRYLRQGVRANAWVLLDQVPLGYEVWRRMNGFPPSLKSQEESDKGNKPPKIKI